MEGKPESSMPNRNRGFAFVKQESDKNPKISNFTSLSTLPSQKVHLQSNVSPDHGPQKITRNSTDQQLPIHPNAKLIPSNRYGYLPLWKGWCLIRIKYLLRHIWKKVWFETDSKAACLTFYRTSDKQDPRNSILATIELTFATYKKENRLSHPQFAISILDRKNNHFKIAFEKYDQRERSLNGWSSINCGTPLMNQLTEWEKKYSNLCVNVNEISDHQEDNVFNFPLQSVKIKNQQIPLKNLLNPIGTIFFLLRHFGCIFCRRAVKKLVQYEEKLSSMGYNIILIGHNSQEQALWFKEEMQVKQEIFLDQKKNLYKLLLCQNNIFYFWNPETRQKVKMAQDEGFTALPLEEKPGDLLQLGGLFIINQKKVLWRFNEKYVGDAPDFDEVLNFCEANLRKFSKKLPKNLKTQQELESQSPIRNCSIKIYQKEQKEFQDWEISLKQNWIFLNNEKNEKISIDLLSSSFSEFEKENFLFPKDFNYTEGFNINYHNEKKEQELISIFFEDCFQKENWFDFLSFLSNHLQLKHFNYFLEENLIVENDMRNYNYILPKNLNFDQAEIISDGPSGIVSKITMFDTTSTVLKFVKNFEKRDKKKSKLEKAYFSELFQILSLRHENISMIYGLSRFFGKLVLLEEFCPEKNMKIALESPFLYPTSNYHTIKILKSFCGAMNFIHNRGIIHKNIKLSNILIQNWEKGEIKLTDFGISTTIDRESTASLAPEIILGKGFNHKLDIFSFSVILFQIVLVEPSFNPSDFGLIEDEKKQLIIDSKFTEYQRPNERIPKNSIFKYLIEECWNEVQKRPKFSTILKKLEELIKSYCIYDLQIEKYQEKSGIPLKKIETISLKNLGIKVLNDIEIGQLISEGSFGKIYQGFWGDTKNKIQVALKTLKNENFNHFLKELILSKELSHSNVISFYGVYQRQFNLFLVIEFMDTGDLLNLLQTDVNITEKQLIEFSFQTSSGMNYLHSQDILHKDLACRNLLIKKHEEKFILKVSDFGQSRKLENIYEDLNSQNLPVRWSAPEVLQFHKSSKASDVFSFGIVLWEIFSRGATPYTSLSNKEVIEHILAGKFPEPPLLTPSKIQNIMRDCYSFLPNERPSFETLENLLQVF